MAAVMVSGQQYAGTQKQDSVYVAVNFWFQLILQFN